MMLMERPIPDHIVDSSSSPDLTFESQPTFASPDLLDHSS